MISPCGEKVDMGSTRTWNLRRTKVDLYTERDEIRWWWRLFATIAAWMILGGFIVFPLALQDKHGLYRTSGFALGVFAITLLSVGYMLSILLCFICQSWLFLQDVIFLPCLSSCALGLFNIIFNVAIRRDSSINNLTVASLIVAVVSMLMYGSAALFVYRKIIVVHNSDRLRRARPGSWADDASLLTTDEMQRRQLLGLLFKKDTDRAPSPEASQETFRIDLPDADTPRDGPRHLYPRDNRSRSVPPSSWELRSVPYHSNWDMPPSANLHSRENSPSSRELRRAEIEMFGTGSRENSRDRSGASVVPRIQRVQTDGFTAASSP